MSKQFLIDGKVAMDRLYDMMNEIIPFTKRNEKNSMNKGTVNGIFKANELLAKMCIEEKIDAIPIEWLKKHSWFNVVDLWEKDCKLKSTEEILYDILKEHNFNSYREYVEYAIKIKALPEGDRLIILRGENEKENES